MRRCLYLQMGAGFLLAACQTPPEPSPLQDMTIIPHRARPDSPAGEKLLRLNKLIDGYPGWQESATPLLQGLTAQKHFDNREWDLAQAGWLEVLKNESGRLGNWAFEQWIATYQKILRQNASSEVLAKILLAETEGGQASAYLVAHKLTEQEILAQQISLRLGLVENLTAELGAPPTQLGRVNEDPLLEQTIQAYCISSEPRAWTSWIRSLSADELAYWQALVADCRGETKRHESLLPPLLEQLSRSSYPGLRVATAQRLVNVYRFNGDRVKASHAYVSLVEALNRDDLQPAHLNISEFELTHLRINQTLWASRNRALVGDYLSARDLVQQAFALIDNAYKGKLAPRQTSQLEELRAEAYHILAFRISYELGDFEAALIQNKLGTRISGLSEDWQFRFAWFEAWYQFRAGRIGEARQLWAALLDRFDRPADQSRVLFWLTWSAHKTGDLREARRRYGELCKSGPFSFYSLLAPRLAELPLEPCPDAIALLEKAKNIGRAQLTTKIDPTSLRRDKELGPMLYRAELAIKAELGELRQFTVEDLHSHLRQDRRPQQDFKAYLYMSRLLYAVGDYFRAIGLSYELSLIDEKLWQDYPDQLHVYFPRPYQETFDRNAARFYLDAGIVPAVARRESAFRPTVTSPAGAIGLLQLMPNTAEKYFNELELSSPSPIADQLLDPEQNVRLGAAYLAALSRRYKGDLPSIFAAYNAGEYAVDRWLEARGADLALVWVEGIPFGETQNYVKSVMRNWEVYRLLAREDR